MQQRVAAEMAMLNSHNCSSSKEKEAGSSMDILYVVWDQ